jgi:hypothetical protein
MATRTMKARGLSPAALIPGILLIGTVKLEQLDVAAVEMGRVGREGFRDRAAQVPALALCYFDFGFGFRGHLRDSLSGV